MRPMRRTSRNILARAGTRSRGASIVALFIGKARRPRGRLRQGRRVAGNELLCKVLCHNICYVIQSMYELGIELRF
jgi:hypothetical protein